MELEQRKEMLTNFLQKVDNVIAEKSNIQVSDGNFNGIGCTSKSHILLNINLLSQKFGLDIDELEFLIGLKGINFHELGHIIYSSDDVAIVRYMSYSERKLWNALDDGRVESLFSSSYPKAGKYFIKAYLKLIYERVKGTSAGKFLVTWSRRSVLPGFVITIEESEFKKIFRGDIKKLEELIDNFVLEPNALLRKYIFEKIIAMLKSSQNIDSTITRDTLVIEGVGVVNSYNKKISTPKLEEAIEECKDSLKEKDKEIREKENKGEGNNKVENIQELKKGVKEMENNIDSDIMKEVEQDIICIGGGRGGRFVMDDTKFGGFRDYPYKDTALRNMLLNLLKKIREEEDYHWKTKVKSGKIYNKNLYRVEHGDYDIFRKWRVGDINSFRKDIGIILDVSGSMDRYWRNVLQTGWGVGEALKSANLGNLEIIQFSTYYNVIKSFFKKSYNFKHIEFGNTNIIEPIVSIKKHFNGCYNNKYLFIVSDMGFTDVDDCKEVLKKINKSGVEIFFLVPKEVKGDYIDREFKEYGDVVYIDLKDKNKLAKVFYSILKEKGGK